eukprot:gene765-biopygen8698
MVRILDADDDENQNSAHIWVLSRLLEAAAGRAAEAAEAAEAARLQQEPTERLSIERPLREQLLTDRNNKTSCGTEPLSPAGVTKQGLKRCRNHLEKK